MVMSSRSDGFEPEAADNVLSVVVAYLYKLHYFSVKVILYFLAVLSCNIKLNVKKMVRYTDRCIFTRN